jgi:hypothetical protein
VADPGPASQSAGPWRPSPSRPSRTATGPCSSRPRISSTYAALADRSSRKLVDIADPATDIFLIAPAEDRVAWHDEVLALCRRAGFTPRVDDGVTDVQAAGLVAAGLGIHPVAASLQRFRRKGVIYRPLRPRRLRIEMGLAWRRDDDSALVQQFRRVAHETARRVHAALDGVWRTTTPRTAARSTLALRRTVDG